MPRRTAQWKFAASAKFSEAVMNEYQKRRDSEWTCPIDLTSMAFFVAAASISWVDRLMPK